MRAFMFTLFCWLTVLLVGCSSKPPQEQVGNADQNNTTDRQEINTDGAEPTPPEDPTDPADNSGVTKAGNDNDSPTADPPAFVTSVLPFLTTDHVAAAGIDVPEAMQSSFFQSIPKELKNKLGEGNPVASGVLAEDSGLIHAWAMVGPISEDEKTPPAMSFLVACKTPEQLEQIFHIDEAAKNDLLLKDSIGDQPYFKEKHAPLYLMRIKDRTLLIVRGEEPFKTMVAQLGKTPDTALVKQLRSAPSDSQIFAAGNIEPVRDQLAAAIAENVNGPMAMLAGIPKQINSANLAVNLDGETLLTGDIEAVDAETASQLKDMLDGLVGLGSGYLASFKKDADKSNNPELMKEGITIGEEALAAFKPTANGAKINLTMTRPDSLKRLPEIMKLLQAEVVATQQSAYFKAATAQLQLFKGCCAVYRLDVGTYPNKLEDIIRRPADLKNADAWQGPYIEAAEIPQDPWKNAFQYTSDGESFEIISFGPDGKKGGGDDIRVTSKR